MSTDLSTQEIQTPSGTILTAMKLYQIYKTGRNEVVALKGLDLELQAGELLTIVGPSGAGKSADASVPGAYAVRLYDVAAPRLETRNIKTFVSGLNNPG